MARTPAQLITEKGGSAVFAQAIGHPPGAVRMMKYRDRLPRTIWPQVSAAFPDLTTDALLKVEAAGGRGARRRSRAA